VKVLEGLELILLVHVVLGHDLLKLGAGHVHAAPSAAKVMVKVRYLGQRSKVMMNYLGQRPW